MWLPNSRMKSTPETFCHSMCDESKLNPTTPPKPAFSMALKKSPADSRSPMARSVGWHSRPNLVPYFLHASKTGPNRSTRSSRLTSRTSRIAKPPMELGSGGLVPQHLALEMYGHGEDLEAAARGLLDALAGIGLRPGIVVGFGKIQLPAGLFPAVVAGLRNEVEPLVLGDVTELSSDEPDLVIRVLPLPVLLGLLVAHGMLPRRRAHPRSRENGVNE